MGLFAAVFLLNKPCINHLVSQRKNIRKKNLVIKHKNMLLAAIIIVNIAITIGKYPQNVVNTPFEYGHEIRKVRYVLTKVQCSV